MPAFKTVGILVVDNTLLENATNDSIYSFLVKPLRKIHYNIVKYSIVPQCENLICYELTFMSRHFDITLVISNVSNGGVYSSLGKIFKQQLVRNEALNEFSDDKNRFSNEEMNTPLLINILKGPCYPILHQQRIFLLNLDGPSYVDQFNKVLLKFLEEYNTRPIFKRLINLTLNGSTLEKINSVQSDSVKTEIVKQSCKNIQLLLTSLDWVNLIEFEKEIGSLVNISWSEPIIDFENIYADNSTHIKSSLQTIENCFQKYGPENVFISFNGGKDCTVLLHLTMVVLKKCYPEFKSKLTCLYVQSPYPFPEQGEFIIQCEAYFNLEVVSQQTDIKTALKNILENRPNFKACLMGTRRTDPYSKNLQSFQMTDRDYPSVMRCNPILDWHYSNIWDYLLYYKVPFCSLYEQGFTSLGNVNNTIKNPNLLHYNIFDETEKYLPACKLFDETEERSGRN